MGTYYSRSKEIDILLSYISAEIKGHAYDLNAMSSLDKSELIRLYMLAHMHDYEHIVGKAISDGAVLSQDAKENGENVISIFTESYDAAIMRYVMQDSVLQTICGTFEHAGIDFIPLKGSVLREFYVNPPMRTSCDIDVLIRNCDLERAIKLLTSECDFKLGEQWQHDVSLFTSDDVHLELHFELVVRDKKSQKVLEDVWNNVENAEGYDHQKTMSNELFILYHVVHMAKHFMNGGCGIRPFADLYVINNSMEWDREELRDLLEKCGLSLFYERCNRLCDVWFGEADADEMILSLEEFILSGGTYGSLENNVKISQARSGGRLKRIMSRAFISYGVLKYQYPILKKYKILFPFYQVKRWIDFLFREGLGKAKREIDLGNSIPKDENNKAEKLLSDLGLSN